MVLYQYIQEIIKILTMHIFGSKLKCQIIPRHPVFAECWETIRTLIIDTLQTKPLNKMKENTFSLNLFLVRINDSILIKIKTFFDLE